MINLFNTKKVVHFTKKGRKDLQEAIAGLVDCDKVELPKLDTLDTVKTTGETGVPKGVLNLVMRPSVTVGLER